GEAGGLQVIFHAGLLLAGEGIRLRINCRQRRNCWRWISKLLQEFLMLRFHAEEFSQLPGELAGQLQRRLRFNPKPLSVMR
ncbi:MAG TPA: hypothetical protein VMP01_29910, partial [Pirellulaceae bacterium]|nr:hypothetical protein [Pirellulaceae bacterium]